MDKQFIRVTSEEYQSLKKAIVWITILVAGADGNIDKDETSWAKRLTKIRSFANDETLHSFYEEVGETFASDLDENIAELPNDIASRNQILSERLSALNLPLSKLPNPIAFKLYESYTSFAMHIAKSSGGILRFFSVSGSEKQVVGLTMLTPIILEEEE